MRIVDLREKPDLLEMVADRIWHAFWIGRADISRLRAAFATHLGPAPMPFTLVALADDRFAGTVSVIAHDADEWPDLSPWVAALWVEPGDRRGGIGATLVDEAVRRAFAQGLTRLHLAATGHNRPFYEQRGWTCRDGTPALWRLTRDAPEPVSTA